MYVIAKPERRAFKGGEGPDEKNIPFVIVEARSENRTSNFVRGDREGVGGGEECITWFRWCGSHIGASALFSFGNIFQS